MRDNARDIALKTLRESSDLAELAEAVGVLADHSDTKPEDLLPALEHGGFVAEQAAIALHKLTGLPLDEEGLPITAKARWRRAMVEHCGFRDSCHAMDYVLWLLDAIEGRLRLLHDRCLAPDFDKNRRSQGVHRDTASHYYQFAHANAWTVCNWLGRSDRIAGCRKLRRELGLLIQNIHDRILTPLTWRATSDQEASVRIDQALTGTREVRRRFPELRDLAERNRRSFGDELLDMSKQG